MSTEKPKSISFSNVPTNITERALRTLFSSCGHITGFRLVGPNPGAPYLFGSVDYLDAKSASDAVSQFNDHPFTQESILSELNATEVKMRVTISTFRKRQRDQQNYHGDRRHAHHQGSDDADHGGPYLDLKPGVVNPILPADKTIESALRACSVADAYEAVEQLRVLAMDRPEEASRLLARHPQLGVAVVMILQHAGKMPMGPLPPEAISQTLTTVSNETASAAPQAAPVKKHEALSEEVVAHVMKIVESLPEEQVDRISKMTAEDFAKIPDPAQRLQLQTLQKQLHLLGQSL